MEKINSSYQVAIEAIAYANWLGYPLVIDIASTKSDYVIQCATGGPCGEFGCVRTFKREKSAEKLREKILARAKARAIGMDIRHSNWMQRHMRIVKLKKGYLA